MCDQINIFHKKSQAGRQIKVARMERQGDLQMNKDGEKEEGIKKEGGVRV